MLTRLTPEALEAALHGELRLRGTEFGYVALKCRQIGGLNVRGRYRGTLSSNAVLPGSEEPGKLTSTTSRPGKAPLMGSPLHKHGHDDVDIVLRINGPEDPGAGRGGCFQGNLAPLQGG